MVVLLYPDILNFTFQNVKDSKCKNVLIDFLDELGNFKQKNFYTSKCRFFLTFYNNGPNIHIYVSSSVHPVACARTQQMWLVVLPALRLSREPI